MIRRGELYRSKVWLNPDRMTEHLPMLITKVSGSTIYYRPVYGRHDDGSLWTGSCAKFRRTDVAKYLGEHVEVP